MTTRRSCAGPHHRAREAWERLRRGEPVLVVDVRRTTAHVSGDYL
jgi:hypothetical protein